MAHQPPEFLDSRGMKITEGELLHPSGCLRINPSLKRQLFDELPKINRMPTLYALCNDIIQVKVNEKLYIEKELNVQEKLINSYILTKICPLRPGTQYYITTSLSSPVISATYSLIFSAESFS